MRKIFAIVLTITAVVMLFTACDGNSGSEITQEPLSTSDTTTTTAPTTTEPTSTTGVTFVLTTNQNKQAPWYSTTRFVPTPGAESTTTQAAPSTSMSNAYENITYPTNGVTTPSVSAVTSAAKTTEWSTIPSDTTTTTKAPESTTTATTEAVEAEGMQVIINSTWFDGDGNFCAAIDKEGWGKIKSNSMRIPIYIDGVEAEKPGTLQISSSVDGDGCQYVFVNVAKYDVLEFGASVSFTIPEGFLKNSSGTRYNYATEVSM